MEAQHEHTDCKDCTLLGVDKDHDYYFCTQGDTIPTVIARFGSEYHEYSSGLYAGMQDPALIVARSLAIKNGLISQ